MPGAGAGAGREVCGGSVSNGGTEAYVRIKEKRPARFGGREGVNVAGGSGGAGDKGTTTRCRRSAAGRISRRLHGG